MNDKNQSDHDILIALKAEVTTKLDRVILDVKELKDNVAARVTVLEEEKASKADLDDTNNDVKTLSRLVYIGLGIVLTLQVALIAWVTYFHQ